jgi:hypothetical protein
MSDQPSQEFTLSKINEMAFAARRGSASQEDAEALLALFCQCVEKGSISAKSPEADRLLEHVRESLRAFLSRERAGTEEGLVTILRHDDQGAIFDEVPGVLNVPVSGIEAAFGLTRKRGRPKGNQTRNETDEEMAAAVLEALLKGDTLRDALKRVEKKFGWGKTLIEDAWVAHKQDALILAREARGESGFTPDEIKLLCRIYKREQWFIAPGKSPK